MTGASSRAGSMLRNSGFLRQGTPGALYHAHDDHKLCTV
uniref:Uncharacterized protein n=1 Tax=Rhizobium rhizogenes TaxID=359 RepID=A0A7S5DS87_RHIRH|nr:hypothetical protein pC6.5c_496 [Rhizobium rhizogenes]